MNHKYHKIDKDKFFFSKEYPGALKKIYWKMSPEYRSVYLFRFGQIANAVYNKNRIAGFILKIIHYLLNYPIKSFHKVYIQLNADIGPGFYIVHASNIMIGDVKIGKNCTIHHNLTIGDRVAKRDKGIAEIGDNVWIGTGVIITGKIKIGSGSTISSGSVLSKDIPENCLVAGNPARIILQNFDYSEFFTYRIK